jgi:SAM-dependent methyltransferase
LIAQLCGSPCVISDGTEETIGILKRNIERNGLTDKVNIEQWLWQTDNAKFKEKYPDGFDFIVGGDLIYSEEAIVPLLETVKEFLKPGGEFLMVHLDRGTRRLGDLMFSKASSEYGLTCTRDELQKIDEDDPDSWRFVFRKP